MYAPFITVYFASFFTFHQTQYTHGYRSRGDKTLNNTNSKPREYMGPHVARCVQELSGREHAHGRDHAHGDAGAHMHPHVHQCTL